MVDKDRERALRLLGEKVGESPPQPTKTTEPQKNKPWKYKLIVGIGGSLLTLFVVYCFVLAAAQQQGYDGIIAEIKALDIDTMGYNIVYSNALGESGDGWYYLQVKLTKAESPWDNIIGYVWYNINTKESRLVLPS